MESKIPKIKKKVNAFLVGEEGKISKQSLLKAGAILSAIAIGPVIGSKTAAAQTSHSNNLALSYDAGTGTAAASHAHHASHSNHSNHGNHGNHSNHGNCCFAAGTLITMADGLTKPIEKVKIGDRIKCYDLINKEVASSEVVSLISPIREGVYNINNGLLKMTNDHPLLVKKKEGKLDWSSIEPEETKKVYNMDVSKLEIGDAIFNETGKYVKISSIKYEKGRIQTYSFKEVKKYKNFFANGLLAHNCGGPCDW